MICFTGVNRIISTINHLWSTNDTMIQWYNYSMVQLFNGTIIQWYNYSMIQLYNDTMIQWYNDTMVQ